MSFNPSLNLTGDAHLVKVSASDVASSSRCGRFLALKARPAVKAVDGWSRLFSPWDERLPIPVASLVDLLREAHRRDHETYEEHAAWLNEALDAHKIHRLLRPYLRLAVDNVLEAHEQIETEVGELRLYPEINLQAGPPGRRLAVWALLYETETGTREIRRFRVGSARADEDSARWALVAGYLAAACQMQTAPTRIRVVEIGAVDGSIAVIADQTPDEARELFLERGQALAAAAADEDHVVPCRSCGDCKAAGSCRALIPLDGILGQVGRGHSSRSVSPADLEQHARCPAQWLLDSSAHLPRDSVGGEAAARGYAVHRWLKLAHSRRIGCTAADLPAPGSGLGIAEGSMTDIDYEIAYPFLLQHIGHCPLPADPDASAVTEEDIYGYDHDAEVVSVTRPDLVYRSGDLLIIREFKTAAQPYESGQHEAYDRHLQVPFQIALLNSGLLSRFGARAGRVELELLTSSERYLWTWDAADPAVAAVALGDVSRAVRDWHTDREWKTEPGPHCAWCPVRRWCPDSDSWQPASSETDRGGQLPWTGLPADSEPPF